MISTETLRKEQQTPILIFQVSLIVVHGDYRQLQYFRSCVFPVSCLIFQMHSKFQNFFVCIAVVALFLIDQNQILQQLRDISMSSDAQLQPRYPYHPIIIIRQELSLRKRCQEVENNYNVFQIKGREAALLEQHEQIIMQTQSLTDSFNPPFWNLEMVGLSMRVHIFQPPKKQRRNLVFWKLK